MTPEGGGIFALDIRDGNQRWRHEAPDVRLTKPVVKDDIVYVAGTSGYIVALRATSGEKRWMRTLGSIDIVGAPAVARTFSGSPASTPS